MPERAWAEAWALGRPCLATSSASSAACESASSEHHSHTESSQQALRSAIVTTAGAAIATEVATAAGIAKAVAEPGATEVATAFIAAVNVAVDATIVDSREQAAVAGMACYAGRTEAPAQARRRTGRLRRSHLGRLDPPHRNNPHYHSCHHPPHRNSTDPAVVGQLLESCPASLRMGSGVASEQPSHSAFAAITALVARSGSRGSLSGDLAEAVLVPIRSRNVAGRTAIVKRMVTVARADHRMAAIHTWVQGEHPSEECRVSDPWQLL